MDSNNNFSISGEFRELAKNKQGQEVIVIIKPVPVRRFRTYAIPIDTMLDFDLEKMQLVEGEYITIKGDIVPAGYAKARIVERLEP